MQINCIVILYIIFLGFYYSIPAIGDDCPGDKSQVAAIRLRKDLLCDYDKNTRPLSNHKDAVPVFLRMILKYFSYDIHDNSFTADSWTAMFWKDEHLKWNPDNYESIKSIHLSDSDIWMPDISVYNSRVQGGNPAAVDTATCIVSNEGQVVCVPSTHHSSLCVADLTKYPFDTHNCTIRYGSWVHSGEELDIRITSPGITTEDLLPNGEWDLVGTKVIKHPVSRSKECQEVMPQVLFYLPSVKQCIFVSLLYTFVTALIIITLTSLWIAPDNTERLLLCYVNLVCEFLYVQYISWMIPMSGAKIPLILLFARDSLLLSVFTVVFSIILKNMVQSEQPAPAWMSKIVCVLVACRPGQVIFLNNSSFKGLTNEQGDDDVAAIINNQDSSSQTKEWFVFAKILDRLCFLIFLIIYVFMFIGFTP